jgi:K(+)-stimulated pyrophosphate-energized sodium pump
MIRMSAVIRRVVLVLALAAGAGPLAASALAAQDVAPTATTEPVRHAGGEANLRIPDLGQVVLNGMDGRTLLMGGLVIAILGTIFGLLSYSRLKGMPVHRAMRDISELIYATCKTYMITQGKFILLLELFIGTVIALYFGVLLDFELSRVAMIIFFSLVGIAGSFGVAWFGIRVNTFANSRTAFASLRGKPYPTYAIPLQSGMSIGMLLISVELLLLLSILLFIPGEYAGACFIGFAIGESLAAAALRIGGGIFTKIADIGADLMKIVFNIKEDDARNPGVIADCTGDNAGDSVGPTADGFETYGVTAVALISFILLAVRDVALQAELLVWMFVVATAMIVASAASYGLNQVMARGRYAAAEKMDFEAPLTMLVRLTSAISVLVTFAVSWWLIRDLGDGTMWWKLSAIISCGTLAGAVIPELVKVFTSTSSRHVSEVVTSSREGGASLNVLSGLVAGNFSGFWLGLAIMGLMALAYFVSLTGGFEGMMMAPAVFAFGLVAFGFLSMGPVTIAVDSYGPVTDNAQSVYELSTIEELPGVREEIQRDYGFAVDFERAKMFLEENDGAGNTFKATAKPVLIGTAVVGATTLIFSIILSLTQGLRPELLQNLTILHPPFLFGMIMGGGMVYWFTGASMQAVTTGAYRAVEFIKANIKLEGSSRASEADSRRVVEICTIYAQRGAFNIFMVLFFLSLAFAFVEPYFFIGFLISTALFGLFQAVFMANAGGAWDNAKKIVETELGMKGTPLHAATVVGDTVGDPFKDTSSVALNPVIKFVTLFGLLAVELAVSLTAEHGARLGHMLSALFFVIALVFVYRSFYNMRIESGGPAAATARTE